MYLERAREIGGGGGVEFRRKNELLESSETSQNSKI